MDSASSTPAAAGSRPPAGQKIDIQSHIEEWAENYFRQKGSKKELKLLDQKQIQMQIDWRRVRFVHDEAKYEPEPPTPGSGRPTQNILYNTTFTNKTERPQTYSFRAERATRSSCTVTVEQGYTQGVELSVKLTTPCQILEANAGFHREMALATGESETVEEEMTWSVDSQIEVPGRHIGEAKLVILEEEYKGSFTIKTHISGKVRVVFTNMKDNNSFIKAAEGQIVDVVKEAIKSKKIPVCEAISIDGTTKTVLSVTRGTCRFKYGIKQMIEVDQRPINDK